MFFICEKKIIVVVVVVFFCLAMKHLLVPLDLHNAQTVVKTDGAFHAKVESQDTVDMYTYVFLVL